MGRAIEQDNRLDDHERRIKLVEDALEELVQTRVHHVDLHNEMERHEEKIRKENNVVKPDKEFAPPTTKRKKITKPRRVESQL